MPSTASASVIIDCPHCGTRYRVSAAAIGVRGRTVQCAHCGKSWEAHAGAAGRRTESELAERRLDERFAEEERRQRQPVPASPLPGSLPADAEEAIPLARGAEHQRTLDEIKAAIAPKPAPVEKLDPATRKKRLREFSLRQASFSRTLPMARVRRTARVAALAAVVLVLGGGVLFRGPIVQQFPGLAGVFEAFGLGVNVIGLEFSDVRTLKSLQQGAEVLVVDGNIRSIASQEVLVPQVIVTLLGADGRAEYEWSVVPKAGELRPGEVIGFETQLTAPPPGAGQVKLTFANGRTQSKAADPAVLNANPADGLPPADVKPEKS